MNPALFATAYSAREEETLQMMYQHRRAGNGAPDRDVGLQPGSTAVRMEIIVD